MSGKIVADLPMLR